MQDLIAQAQDYIFQTYTRSNIVIESGKGIWLKDINGKEYLDFGAGIAVCALGYGHIDFNNALKAQIDKMLHTSNLYYNKPAILAAQNLCKESGMSKIFFTNSGTEANEGAIKVAKKYAFVRDKHHKHNIIAFHNGFHGRSLGSLSLTANPKYQNPFKPLLEGIRFADFNNIASVEQLIDSQTCAIILETLQGEGGITPVNREFLKRIRAICDDNDILLILDEIQCGMGRTGKMFAWQHFGILPDVFTSAKGLGCGIPVGAFGVNEKVSLASLVPGDHGSTYGGNPFVCAGINSVFEIFQRDNLVENAKNVGEYLASKLDEMIEQHPILLKRQGMGLLQGVWVQAPSEEKSQGEAQNTKSTYQENGIAVSKIVSKALDNGLILLSAGGNSLRFAPPLIVNNEDIDLMIERLNLTLKDLGI